MRRASRLPLEELQPYLLETPSPKPGSQPPPAETLDWPAVFGNEHAVEIEIGFGKGMFLVTAAAARADVNYLGIEIERKYQLFAANRLAKRGLRNVRLACTDARLFLRDRVAGASIQAMHVYFPDPWWKTRHRKRRLFTEEFAAQCVRVLRPAGRLYLVTDVAAYYTEILDLLSRRPEWKCLPPPEPHAPRHDLDYLTHFERKYRLEARPIHRAIFEREAQG